MDRGEADPRLPPGGPLNIGAVGAPLHDRLALVDLGKDRFRGAAEPGRRHVFGGLVVAQALAAACRTVGVGQHVHSLHANFVRTGRFDEPIDHHVERTRDGSSFSTRRVVVRQRSVDPVLVLTASFHVDEDGDDYQPPVDLSGLPSPDDLGPGRYDGDVVDCRDVPPVGGPPHERRMWFRVRGVLGDDPLDHVLALAYASDNGPTRAAREPQADRPDRSSRQSLSLDHAVWFLRPARADRWLLSTLRPMSTGRSRGLVHGTVHTADGVLVAAVTQEALQRLGPPEGQPR